MLLAAIIFSALPLVSARDDHITVDLIDAFVPKFIAWLKALESVRYGDQTAMLLLPTAPVFFFISLALGLSSFIALLLAWQYARGSSHNV